MKPYPTLLLALFIAYLEPTSAHGQAAPSAFERCASILKFGGILSSLSEPSKVDAVHALGLLGDPRAIPLLAEHLENEPNDNLRLHIVRALGWIGSTAAIPPLEKALKDKYPYVRARSAEALRKITGREYEYDKSGLPDPATLQERLKKAREAEKKG